MRRIDRFNGGNSAGIAPISRRLLEIAADGAQVAPAA